ncbi:MAG: dethiobiotin synthase [Akkermansia sp.]
MNNFFITGTDTDVGKSHVCCALLRDLCQRGINAMGYKPMACGDRADARGMRDACASKLSLEQINPVYLRAATAPYIAAQLENKSIGLDQLIPPYEQLASDYDCVLVEGAGGWEVPISKDFSISDLAQELNLPILLVVNNKLGAVNHTILTLAAIKARGLRCVGIILNHISEEWDTASITNRKLIEDFCDVPILAELISGQEELDSSFLDAL